MLVLKAVNCVFAGAYECKVCNKQFRTQQTCSKHLSVHLGLATCPVCSTTLCNQQSLRRHIRNVHQLPCVMGADPN
jgi:C2H2-type zinc finger